MTHESSRNLTFEPCHLKDAKRLKQADTGLIEARAVKRWREAIQAVTARGGTLMFITEDGVDRGAVEWMAPSGSATWRLGRLYGGASLTDDDLARLSRELCERAPSVYRVDWVWADAPPLATPTLTGLFEIGRSAHWLTFYAPAVARRQIAFVPWAYGYVGIRTTPERDRIESIEFVRGNARRLSEPMRQAAYYADLIDRDGEIAEGRSVPEPSCPFLKTAVADMEAYLAGDGELHVPYKFPEGTDFQRRVWKAAQSIPYGAVETYTSVAETVEPDPDKARNLARAVGQALGANPLPLLIPCHRVIGANRDLTGFAGGVDIKAHLLQMEMWRAAAR
ncbi:MAG: methylated-DNA--[protein]-cysteine S-methyltransferase [Saccharofermentanales bacterium]|jgi:methylated-DNA-[protein]-cysteine S-methyltransferase